MFLWTNIENYSKVSSNNHPIWEYECFYYFFSLYFFNQLLSMYSFIHSFLLTFPNAYMSHAIRKPAFCICENKDADQLRDYQNIDSTIPLLAEYEISNLYVSHIVWSYSLVCVGPGWKPRRQVFSQRGSYMVYGPLSMLPHGNTPL